MIYQSANNSFVPEMSLGSLENLTESKVLFFLWDNWKSPALGAFLLIVGIASLGIKGFIIKYVLYDAGKRPINLLILFEQITMLLCNLVLYVGSLTSVFTGRPLYDFGGLSWCMINWFFGVWFYAFSSVNSFGLAIFRMVVMKWPMLGKTSLNGDNKLAASLLALMISTASILLYFWVQGIKLTKVAMLLNFCTGRNNFFSNVLADYEGRTVEELKKGTGIQSVVLLISLGMNMGEMVCYIVITKALLKQNKSMIGILNSKSIQSRNKGSVITLGGQIISFMVEIFTMIFVILAVNGFHILEPAFVQIILFLQGCAISFVQIATSPELRRFFLNDNKIKPA